MSNWIDLSIMQTDWKGLKITSHCYGIGGTSYLYHSGLDIPSLQRSGRWSLSDPATVEHYLKPGLYSTSPATIHAMLPRYKSSMTLTRAMYLRDCITTTGGSEHPFNKILADLDFANLQCSEYPTAQAKRIQQWRQIVSLANDYLKEVQLQHTQKNVQRAARLNISSKIKLHSRSWRQQQQTSTLRTMTNYRMNEACKSCQVIQKCELVSQAKIQSLSNKILNQESIMMQLQEARSQMAISTA